MAGADFSGLIFRSSRRLGHPPAPDTLGTAGEEQKGRVRQDRKVFYGINIKILYMNKTEACSTEDFKASKNIPSALAKGNRARLSMESIIVCGGVQGGRSA